MGLCGSPVGNGRMGQGCLCILYEIDKKKYLKIFKDFACK